MSLKAFLSKNTNFIFWFSFLIILAIIFLVVKYQNSSNNKNLMINHAFTLGKFTGEITMRLRDHAILTYSNHTDTTGSTIFCPRWLC